MKFVFTDKKVNVPNYIHNYAEKKVGKLDRFFKEDATAVTDVQRGEGPQPGGGHHPVQRHHLPCVGEHL